MKHSEIFDFLCEKFPLDTALDFDNPGFLVGNKEDKTKGVLIALDCELDTVKYAVKNECNLIITHHPVIFSGLKNVLYGSVVYELIKNGISVISMHTNLDFGKGGVNDALCRVLGFSNVEIITTNDGCQLRKCKISPTSPYNMALMLKASLNEVVRYTDSDKIIENVLICAGSGGNFLEDAVANNCQALITADVKHNVFIDSVNYGISVFDAGHYATEDVIIEPLLYTLSVKFRGVKLLTYHSKKIKSC
ncbi:MAG: Nif3-like dinuclear metal center hexameric protein [Clostridia bacterium]|nr:Nif3-like dinuclear metal center hexameric protein [Clostridia bacterium]